MDKMFSLPTGRGVDVHVAAIVIARAAEIDFVVHSVITEAGGIFAVSAVLRLIVQPVAVAGAESDVVE